MTAAKKLQLISVEAYLAGETDSQIKHEYLGGTVYAMAGARVAHDDIAVNIVGTLHAQLRRKRCRPHSSDMKIRVELPRQTRFYYPDASVVCSSQGPESTYQDQPAAIFEVLSKGTRRIDEGEKYDAYLTIPSLCVYALVEQEAPLIVVHRRTESGFVREVYEGLISILPLPEIQAELALADIYEGIVFSPEAGDEE